MFRMLASGLVHAGVCVEQKGAVRVGRGGSVRIFVEYLMLKNHRG